jgi:NAD(P)-dependent dehydrogenase (short-subunit alcohol dehydrogenase family)
VPRRDADRGSAAVDTITAEGGKARFVAADLTDLAQLDHLVDQVGPVDKSRWLTFADSRATSST